MVATHMLAYGTDVVAGVTPGKGGQEVNAVPVYDSVWEAQRAHQATIALTYVPPPIVYDAAQEAIANGLQMILIPTENVPQHDMMRLLDQCEKAGVLLIGPNSVGMINPATRLKLGAIGGDDPSRSFVPGRIGVISRSGDMTAEIAHMVQRADFGVSTAISVGGDALIGSPPAKLLRRFEQDPETDAVVLFSEPGTQFEERVAEMMKMGLYTKPLVFVIGGLFTEELPAETVFGHSATLIQKSGAGRPSDKMQIMADAGALVAERYADLIPLIKAIPEK
ncbi:CoA-binding protein [Chloroflexi bacterium TSY]|nr:CoA-binding protein [Chloroflexi bacterium TSY]